MHNIFLERPNNPFTRQPLLKASPQIRKHQSRLAQVMVLHLIFAILLMFQHFSWGLKELFLILVLWCGAQQVNYYVLIFYQVLCITYCVSTVAYVGLFVQHKAFPLIYSIFSTALAMTVLILLIFFYTFAVCFAFIAYRDFKYEYKKYKRRS